METFGKWVDRAWLRLASVKITFFVMLGLALLSIPGTLVKQVNISNVDPALLYGYDFWRFATLTQLFTAYHSFWYVTLIVVLSLNLIAGAMERWSAMRELATAKPLAWSLESFKAQPANLLHEWNVYPSKDVSQLQKRLLTTIQDKNWGAVVTESSDSGFQIFFQTGRWSRIAHFLVHGSLLVIFAGAMVSAQYGFEGSANIPTGQSVDRFLVFKEGKAAGLKAAPGGLPNERLLGFSVAANDFNVEFYKDFPGRPKDFVSRLEIFEGGKSKLKKTVRVNEPLDYKNFTFYQASYGRMGDYSIKFRVIGKQEPQNNTYDFQAQLTEVQQIEKLNTTVVAVNATVDLRGLGPAVQFVELKDNNPVGEPFWVMKEMSGYDARRSTPWWIAVQDVRELYATGLQISYDPGAPVYWLGCAGLLLGICAALLVTHKKYYLRYEKGQFSFSGGAHRLPTAFEQNLAVWADKLKLASQGS